MGAVFVAEHLGLHKQVALKVVHAEYADNQELLARFAREALAGSRIDHPSVVAALDYGALAEGGAYLVMPLVPGENLSDVLKRRGALPWAEAVELGVQIAGALAAAAAQGFVHRDLKPDNILIETRESGAPLARVIDFGIARLSEELSESGLKAPPAQPLTKAGAIIGTPGYMAPEQALGKPATHAADLYSLGVVLWEALAGQPLWLGDSIQAILQAQLKLTPPAIRDKHPQAKLPPALEELVQQLLSRRPEQRPESALAVRDRLQALLPSNSARAPQPAPPRSGSRQVWMVLFSMLAAGTVLGSTLALGPREASSNAAAASSAAPELEPIIRELLAGAAPARRVAARKLLEPQSAPVPAYARELARLELGKSCQDKRAALRSLLELADERVSPALERLSSEPATGCGPRKDQDCLSCLRRELRASLGPRG